MAEKFYITAAIPYVNAKPHIGHALEFVQTDVISRYHKLLGDEVLTLSGGDENALKNVQAAEAAGEPIQAFVDKNTELFHDLAKKLNVQFDIWQKGSNKEQHFTASQKLWKLCQKNGDIYKKSYKGLYCTGCELFYEPEELNNKGECFEHPGKKLEEVEEENYFFKLSRYTEKITKLIKDDELLIVPQERKNEVLAFLKEGLKDISISRSNERAKNWGVPVPDDKTQRIYVWFDALNIYQSGVGFGWNEEKYNKCWPADLHVIGKGIIRFHAVYWPAFLLSAGLKLPKKIFVHGYYTVDGQKMSKTLGNVYDPVPLLEKYGADALRYYMLAKTPPFTDGDFSEEKFVEAYNSDLANGLGNLAARVAKLCENNQYIREKPEDWNNDISQEVIDFTDSYRFDSALGYIWGNIKGLDQYIEKERPWQKKLSEDNQKLSLRVILNTAVSDLVHIGLDLRPFLPETAEKILKQFKGPKIKALPPMFPRIKQ